MGKVDKKYNVFVCCPRCDTLLHVYNKIDISNDDNTTTIPCVGGMLKVVTTFLLYRHHPHFEGNILCMPVGPKKFPQLSYEIEEAT